MQRSRGLWFASAMLALMAFECVVLAEIVFGESVTDATGSGRRILTVYWIAVTATVLMQIVGMQLVLAGRYRLGGALQIAASVLHVPKIEGILGLLGGLRARRCAEPAQGGDDDAAGTATPPPAP